jgi:DNA-binding CsgD family transcriptional regulator
VLCRPFIGRLEELAYLRERRLEAGSSRGGFVLIAGDAGVGKSRLISEFCSSLAYSRWKIGIGACSEFASRPYGPILEVLAGLDPMPFDVGEAETKQEQLDTIVGRLTKIAARNAAIVVVEDLHWADAATLDLLAYLASKVHGARILVVASVRADELHPGHPATRATARIARSPRASRIELAPLHGADLRTFIDEALAGIALPEETRRAIALAGEGNPFFTEELLKNAVERRRARTEDRSRRDLPLTMRSALIERLRPFDETERRVIVQAAVIGRTFDVSVLAATLETDPAQLMRTIRRARDFQLVEEVTPSHFRFRHGLTRSAICEDFLEAELRPRHRAIALILENAPQDERSPEALAYHWWAGGDSAKAAYYNERAADEATKVHAHEDAVAFYQRVLECLIEPAVRASIVEKIARRRMSLGLTVEAKATFDEAAEAYRAVGSVEREARCRVAAAITAYGIGRPEPTRGLEAMLTRLDAGEYLARSRIHLGLAWLAATFRFPTRAALHLEQVDRRSLAEVTDISMRYHNVAAWIAMTVGDLAEFRREHALWVAAARAGDYPQATAIAYANGALCCSFFGLHEEALENIELGLRAAREARSRHSEESVHALAVLCHLLRGDLRCASDALAEVSPGSENRVNVTFAMGYGVVIGAALDDDRLIHRWFDEFERTVAQAPELECAGGFAEIMVRRGRLRDAAALLHRSLPECELVRGNIVTLLAVGRYGAPADRKRAREYLARAAEARSEMPERPALALFDAFECARDGRTDVAHALANEAVEGFRHLRLPLFEAAALEVAGDLDGALALFRRCGAVHEVRRLAGDGSAAIALSPREREIAALAAGGRSNLEIAHKLSITHKTVEKHLASVYRKLDISSRSQLGTYVKALTQFPDRLDA